MTFGLHVLEVFPDDAFDDVTKKKLAASVSKCLQDFLGIESKEG